MMKEESEYVNQLKKLIVLIQSGFGPLDINSKEQMVEKTRKRCHDKKERILLNDLIVKAQELSELERIVKEHKCSEDESEKYFLYQRWFNSIKMLIVTFDVPLKKLSFSDLSLVE
jgi:hypothetical protein